MTRGSVRLRDLKVDQPGGSTGPEHGVEHPVDHPRVGRIHVGAVVRAEQIAGVVRHIRDQSVRKAPSVSESIDWARTLLALGIDQVDEGVTTDTLHVLLKYQADIDKVAESLA